MGGSWIGTSKDGGKGQLKETLLERTFLEGFQRVPGVSRKCEDIGTRKQWKQQQDTGMKKSVTSIGLSMTSLV